MRGKRSAEDPESLRRLLVSTRAKEGLTQAQVIKRIGCTPTTYKAWEKGQRPRAEWYVAISKHCGVTVERVVDLVTADRT